MCICNQSLHYFLAETVVCKEIWREREGKGEKTERKKKKSRGKRKEGKIGEKKEMEKRSKVKRGQNFPLNWLPKLFLFFLVELASLYNKKYGWALLC